MSLTMFSFSTARTGSRSVLYGPQGQIRTREEIVNVGQDNVPAGQDLVLGRLQPARRATSSRSRSLRTPRSSAKGAGAVSLEHGIDDRERRSACSRARCSIGDERLTFVEGTVRRSIGGALVEVGAARESNGGTAAHAQMLGKFGPVNVNAEALTRE